MTVVDPHDDDQERLESLLLAFDEALPQRRPEKYVAEATLPDFLADKLRGLQATLRTLERARLDGLSADDLLGGDNANDAGYEPAEIGSRAMRDMARPSLAGQCIGRFELVRELGRGGYGVVFLAEDERLGRFVALKVPRPEVLISTDTRRRFLREAKAAGVLAHPNLIPIHEVGEDGPICYIASEYCSGPNLAEWLASRSRPVAEREAAAIVRALAQGVAHAHRRGVLHRDIKPSNVLLEFSPEIAEKKPLRVDPAIPTPRLTDFGLAKMAELADDQTRSGTLLGTPTYMAPEQAEGRLDKIGPATDVYALGVLLYETLVGQPPLRGSTDVQTLQLVAQGDVPRPRRLRPDVSRDLEAITLKCLEKEPVNRYGSAEQLADDLQRFLRGEPSWARPAGSVERTVKWVKRRPALATVVAVMIVATTVLSGGGWWYSGQLSAALDQAELQKRETEKHLYAASMSLADQAIQANQTEQAQQHLVRWIPKSGEHDSRSFAWHHLWRQLHDEELTLRGHTGEVYCVSYSADGRLLATASQDQTARIWNAATGECLFVLKGHVGDVNSVAFSPTGRFLATAGDDGTVRIWLVADGSLYRKKRWHKGSAFGVAFSHNGAAIASCGSDKKVKIVNVRTGKLTTTFSGHEDAIGALAFSPDGKWLATASDDATARLWDVETGKRLRTLVHEGAVNCLSFSADGTHFMTGQRVQRLLRHWDLTQELDPDVGQYSARRVSGRTYEWIHAVAFHPKSEYYAVATKDGSVDLCLSDDDAVVRRIRGHEARVWALSFSGDGRRLATASADGTVKIWNLSNYPETIDTGEMTHAMSLTTDGRTMAVGNSFGRVTIFDVAKKKALWSVGRECQVIGDFNGDGRRDKGTFVSDGTWHLKIASTDSAEVVEPLTVQFDGKGMKSGGSDNVRPLVGDWDGDGRDDLGCYWPATNTCYLDLNLSGGEPELVRDLGATQASPDSRSAIAGRWEQGDRDSVSLVSFAEGTWTAALGGQKDAAVTHRFKGDGACIPLAGRWQSGRPNDWGLWDRAAGVCIDTVSQTTTTSVPQDSTARARVAEFSSPELSLIDQVALDAAFDSATSRAVNVVAISPDGAQVAVGYRKDYRLNVWDVRTKRKTHVLRARAGHVIGAAFSPDGRSLAMASSAGELVQHDARTFQIIHRTQAHDREMFQLAYSHDGRLLATLGDANTLNLWDTKLRHLKSLRDPSQKPVACLAFSPDDRLIAVGGGDRIVRIWSVETGQKLAILTGHASPVNGVAFSRDMRSLTTASDDAIKFWDVDTWQELLTLVEGLGPYSSIAFAEKEFIVARYPNTWRGKSTAIQFWPYRQHELADSIPVVIDGAGE